MGLIYRWIVCSPKPYQFVVISIFMEKELLKFVFFLEFDSLRKKNNLFRQTFLDRKLWGVGQSILGQRE